MEREPMDPSDWQRVWDELEALRTRVTRLEAEQQPAPAVSAERRNAPAPVFTQPEKPSIESRIGSQVFNRVGIVALLIGCAWFLQYAVDQRWLGPAARVLVGLAAGAGLTVWAERFHRRSFPVFSYSLRAVGTGALYLSLWAAYLLFHLVPAWVAFLGMVLVTVGNGALCWQRRSQLLAALAAIGGFLTPALLAQPAHSTVALGIYLLLLNAGLLALIVSRRWPRLLPGAFVGTLIYYVPFSLGQAFHPEPGEWQLGILFVSIFFGVFALSTFPVATMDREGRHIAVGVSIANAVLGFSLLWLLLSHQHDVHVWLAGMVALVCLGLLAVLRSRPATAAALGPTYAGLGIGFVTLCIWTALSGGWMIAAWAVESILLFLLAARLREPVGGAAMTSPAPAAAILGLAGCLLVSESIDGALEGVSPAFLNVRFGLYLGLIAIAVTAVRLAARQHSTQRNDAIGRQWTWVAGAASIAATVLLLMGGVVELHTFWGATWSEAERFSDSAWAGLLGTALLVFGFRVRWAFLRWQALALLTLAIGKVFLFDTRELSQGFRILSFLGLGMLLLGISFVYQRDLLNLRGREHGE